MSQNTNGVWVKTIDGNLVFAVGCRLVYGKPDYTVELLASSGTLFNLASIEVNFDNAKVANEARRRLSVLRDKVVYLMISVITSGANSYVDLYDNHEIKAIADNIKKPFDQLESP